MRSPLSFVVIDSDRYSRNAIEDVLKTFGDARLHGSAADFHEGLGIIRKMPPTIVIMEARDIEKVEEEVKYLSARFPGISVFVTASEKNPDWILRLIRAGAGEYLTRPVIAQELAEAIRKVARLHARESGQTGKKGPVFTVYNPSGGMGTTTIAVNLAATLAARGKQVALIDLNLFNGDVGSFLDLTPRYTLSSIIAQKGQIDTSLLRSIIVPHASGVHVLNGPRELAEAKKIPPELLQEVIEVVQGVFDYTIIDSGGQLSDCNLATFGCSDRVLFTTVLNLPALHNARRYLMAMGREGLGTDRVKLLVNRHTPRSDIKIADAEKVLDTRAYLTVPNAYADASTSINKGMPLISCYPKSPVTKAMSDLAGQLTQLATP